LNIRNINHVKLLNIGDGHLDIEATVRTGDDRLVSLSVPVSFPRNCAPKIHSPQEFEFCVIDNLGELNKYASEAVNKVLAEEEEERKRTEDHKRQFLQPTFYDSPAGYVDPNEGNELDMILAKELCSDLGLSYPDWWQFPNSNSNFGKECQSVQDLLNEAEFQYDIQKLVSRTLEAALTAALEATIIKTGKMNDLLREGDKLMIDGTLSNINSSDNVDEYIMGDGSAVGMQANERYDVTQQHHVETSNNEFHHVRQTELNDNIGLREDYHGTVEQVNDKKMSALVVNQVGVAALGPTGIILKASISSSHVTGYDILDIPFQFPIPAYDEDSLTNSVLDLVDAEENFDD
jgi:hypothetical protein